MTLKGLFRSLVDNTYVLLKVPLVAQNLEAVRTFPVGFLSGVRVKTVMVMESQTC